jgi:two-component system, response regulator PdtaR
MFIVDAPIPFAWRAASGGPRESHQHDARDAGETTGTRQLRILIVEDEVFVAMDAEAILTEAGHIVVGTAASAEEAVAKAALLSPDLIFMDIRLNGARDGIDAAAEIRRRHSLPIVFVTANVDPMTHARAMQIEPLDIISKPFNSGSLLRALATLTKS